MVATLLRETPGDAGHTLDLRDRVGALIERPIPFAPLAAEIDATGEFTHEQQVDALDHCRLERRGGPKLRQHRHGTQVGVDAEFRAQAQQGGLRTDRCRGAPLRPADGAEQHGIGGEAAGQGLRR